MRERALVIMKGSDHDNNDDDNTDDDEVDDDITKANDVALKCCEISNIRKE